MFFMDLVYLNCNLTTAHKNDIYQQIHELLNVATMANDGTSRLIDYLAVVGVKKPNGNAKQVPVLLNR